MSLTMHSQSLSPPKRSKKACTECRQQKAKCDAYLGDGGPCSRCAKMNAQCVISDPFRRQHKRKRFSELQLETDELRRRLRSSQSSNPEPSPIAMLTAAAEMSNEPTQNVADLQLSDQYPTPASSHAPQSIPSFIFGPIIPRPEPVSRDRASDPTEPRVLNTITVAAVEVDDIFDLFFDQYYSFLPILDRHTTPNSYYAQCPFLFWAIIAVACRTYPKNPTLFTALCPSVMEMACLAIASTSAPWHIIQGLVVILSWPFPKDMTRSELTFPLAGMLLHIAMQNGLHIPMSSHEFVRKKLLAPSEVDMNRRSELWAHCVLVYQRACMMKGHPPRSLNELEHDLGQRQVLFQRIPAPLALQVRCQELVARCCASVLEIGVRTMSSDQEKALDILLRTYEDQISDLESQISSADDRFYTTSCLLNIQSLHFLKNTTMQSTNCAQRIVNTSCTFIDFVENIRQQIPALPAVPFQVYFGMLLASAFLLRILKGPFQRGVDVERAKASFFTAINLGKQMTVGNDAAAKMVTVMNQLWNSTKTFRKADGLEHTALRIRSRLVVSPVIDAVWWWRDEFDPQNRPVIPPQGGHSQATDVSRDSTTAATKPTAGCTDRQDAYLFDDQFFSDFEWALADEGFFLPIEPYGAWTSGGAPAP